MSKTKSSLIWVASVIGAGAVMALVFGALERPTAPRTISVTGQCLTSVPRDRTAITLRVTTLDVSASASMKKATTQVATITKFLKTQNVDIQTTQFNSYEKHEWNRALERNEILGIETTIALEISAKNIETIERVLSQFAGIPNVYSENLRTYAAPETIQHATEECLPMALKNARDRAGALLAGDDRYAGRVLSVSYGASAPSVNAPMPRMMATKMAVAGSAMDMGGVIVSQDTDISVTVSATFEIK